MKPIKFYFRRFLDKLSKNCYEGPRLPTRFRDEILLFRVNFPIANVEECIQYAIRVAEIAYENGFSRGMDWKERCLLENDKDMERLHDEVLHNYDIAANNPNLREIIESGEDPNNPLKGVSLENHAEMFNALGEYAKTNRVVIVDENGNFLKYFGD